MAAVCVLDDKYREDLFYSWKTLSMEMGLLGNIVQNLGCEISPKQIQEWIDLSSRIQKEIVTLKTQTILCLMKGREE